jgi:hypothetical protein
MTFEYWATTYTVLIIYAALNGFLTFLFERFFKMSTWETNWKGNLKYVSMGVLIAVIGGAIMIAGITVYFEFFR